MLWFVGLCESTCEYCGCEEHLILLINETLEDAARKCEEMANQIGILRSLDATYKRDAYREAAQAIRGMKK